MIVKMCGLRTREAVTAAETAGADLLGFVFWPRSRRYVEPEVVREISSGLHVHKVGVFVDATLPEVREIAELCGLDYVQLHGHEDGDYARAVGRPVIKAFRYGDGFSAEAANAYPAEMILLDSFRQGVPGGTGETFAWREAASETAGLRRPLLVAGGIRKENLAEMVSIFEPYGVDVSGGLEENGEKSPAMMQDFMAEARRWRQGDQPAT